MSDLVDFHVHGHIILWDGTQISGINEDTGLPTLYQIRKRRESFSYVVKSEREYPYAAKYAAQMKAQQYYGALDSTLDTDVIAEIVQFVTNATVVDNRQLRLME